MGVVVFGRNNMFNFMVFIEFDFGFGGFKINGVVFGVLVMKGMK